MSWVGFTDEELKRLKREQYGDEDLQDLDKQPRKQPTAKLARSGLNSAAGKRQRPREKLRTRNTGNAKVRNGQDGQEMPRLSKVQQRGTHCAATGLEDDRENSSPECEESDPRGQKEPKSPSQKTMSSFVEGKSEKSSHGIEDCSGSGTTSVEPEITVIDEPERIKAMELSALQRMQQKQKEMEEDNKKKTVALQETIRKRYKKTQAETQTLTMVQKELSHLDNLLSADVKILRDQIDQACKDYLYAQKRYERAETEFIAAKLNLHHRTERKELLTEHLYTVIQANEQRKAKKLESLMAKLNLSQDSIERHEEKTEVQGSRDDPEKTDQSQSMNLSNASEGRMAEEKVQDSNKGDVPCGDGKTFAGQVVTVQSESTDTAIKNTELQDTDTTPGPESSHKQ